MSILRITIAAGLLCFAGGGLSGCGGNLATTDAKGAQSPCTVGHGGGGRMMVSRERCAIRTAADASG